MNRSWCATLSLVQTLDRSNGYESIAPAFIAGRGQSHGGVGVGIVAEWSRSLPPGASILDLGCGTGIPISETLIDFGFHVFGVDASPSMVAAFRKNFPATPIQCEAAEDSDFFGRSFDAVVAWGLLFLLTPELQRWLITRISGALLVGGQLLFTAPREPYSWRDAMTGLPSFSLGNERYRRCLEANQLRIMQTAGDKGENHYYFVTKFGLKCARWT